jgi:hypothetical protein
LDGLQPSAAGHRTWPPYDEKYEHTITRDEIIHPAPGKDLRLVTIKSDHLTDSGARDTAVVFDCIGGLIKAVFEKFFLYGAKINYIGGRELVFEFGKWAEDDPMCCPSEECIEVYRWDETADTTIRKR